MTASAIDAWQAAEATPKHQDIAGRQAGSPFAQYDTFDRKQPRRLGISDYLLLVARFDPGRVRQVPALAIVEDGLDDEGEFSLVACPCGARPIARQALAKCSGCERYYAHVELGSAYVCYGAMAPPPLPQGIEDEPASS